MQSALRVEAAPAAGCCVGILPTPASHSQAQEIQEITYAENYRPCQASDWLNAER